MFKKLRARLIFDSFVTEICICVCMHVYDRTAEWGDLKEKQMTTMMFESDDEWRGAHVALS